jgi:uncharacterized membrane protein
VRHPVHAALVHLPMGLLLATPLFDALGRKEVASACCALGCAGAVVAAVAGFVDFGKLERDSPAETTAFWHMGAMLVALSAFAATLLLRGTTDVGLLACDALGLGALGVGGWLGGELVYRHGVGRPASPPGTPRA